MIPRPMLRRLAPMLCATLLIGCGIQQATTSGPADQPTAMADRVATDVAVARAVAATLTAGVPSPAAESATEELPAPTSVPPSPPTDTPEPLPTPTEAPTDISEEPLPMAYAPGGNSDNVIGGIVVPSDGRIINYSENNDLEV